jgi:threonine synthase
MEIKYISTLDKGKIEVSAVDAIIKGQAPDGGLYVPTALPKIEGYLGKSYQETAAIVLEKFFPGFNRTEIEESVDMAYSALLPVKLVGNFLETYHGNTFAFKDVALQLYPYLLKLAKDKQGITDDIAILVATSGDTGPATLAGAAHVDGLFTVVLFPEKGVSEVQRLQMVTQTGSVSSIQIAGNYDDAQKAIRALLSDKEFEKMFEGKMRFTTASSINVARLLPQLVYFFWSYSELVSSGKIKQGDEINFVVPSGNFGNALACFYAKQMGLPIKRLIVASNENNVLCDFFKTGVYDKNRQFKVTHSTAMDILHVTNLPRVLHSIFGVDETIRACRELDESGRFEVDKEKLEFFWADYTTDEQTRERIKAVYESTGYVIDPHTAVAENVYQRYVTETGDDTFAVILSTASPYKFKDIVETSIGTELPEMPARVLELFSKEVLHKRFIQKPSIETIKAEIIDVLKDVQK